MHLKRLANFHILYLSCTGSVVYSRAAFLILLVVNGNGQQACLVYRDCFPEWKSLKQALIAGGTGTLDYNTGVVQNQSELYKEMYRLYL